MNHVGRTVPDEAQTRRISVAVGQAQGCLQHPIATIVLAVQFTG